LQVRRDRPDNPNGVRASLLHLGERRQAFGICAIEHTHLIHTAQQNFDAEPIVKIPA